MQRLEDIGRAKRIGDVEFLEPGDGDDVAGFRLVDRRPFDAAEGKDLRNAALLDHVALAVEHFYRLVRLDRSREDAARNNPPEIGIGLQQSAEHAETAIFDARRRHVPNDQIEERRHVALWTFRAVRHPALFRRAVKDRKVELFVGRVESGKEIEDLVDNFARACVGLVHLVDRYDRPQADLQGLADDEFRLRHRSFRSIDEDDHAIDHGEDALDLAAEIGVAGSIDDIYPIVFPGNRGCLGHDRDAALFFEVIRIHDALGDALILAEGAGLLQEPVDEGRLAVVDVGYDGDVAQVHEILHPTFGRVAAGRNWVTGAFGIETKRRRPDMERG